MQLIDASGERFWKSMRKSLDTVPIYKELLAEGAVVGWTLQPSPN